MTDVHSIADDQVRSAFKRWQNLEEEKARVADDLKELFAEQKALGHDTKAMRAAFRLKVKLDEADPAEAEHEALVDTYLAALEAPRASRAYARENIEQFDANPRLIKQVVDGMQTEAGRAALLTAVDIMIARDEAEENSPETATRPGQDVQSPSQRAMAGENLDVTGGESAASISDQPLTGGDHEVTGIAERDRDIPTSNTGEGTALSALPANSGVVMEDVPEMPMKRPDFISCFPELPNAEYARLREEIREHGICGPIIRQGDIIVDGWERFLASRELGYDYPVQEYTGTDVLLDVIELQRASRDFTPAQEKKIAADLAKEFPQRADEIITAFGLVEALEAAE